MKPCITLSLLTFFSDFYFLHDLLQLYASFTSWLGDGLGCHFTKYGSSIGWHQIWKIVISCVGGLIIIFSIGDGTAFLLIHDTPLTGIQSNLRSTPKGTLQPKHMLTWSYSQHNMHLYLEPNYLSRFWHKLNKITCISSKPFHGCDHFLVIFLVVVCFQ